MNYILLHWSYGHGSIPAIIEKMDEPCNALAKTSSGEWKIYSNVNDHYAWSYVSTKVVMDILRDSGNNVINWGNHIFSDDSRFDLNKPSAVALASNKAESRRVLQNAGVAVPKTGFWGTSWDDLSFPMIARPAFHHGGKHFHVLNTIHDYVKLREDHPQGMSGWYFSEVFPKTNEYRLHVAHGKILAMYEKPLIPGEIRGNFSVNHESWRVLKWSEYNLNISQQCIRAVQELGLDYGAVDIMANSENNTISIAEVNTSPQTTWDYLSGKYAAYFDWVIRHDFPGHFPVDGTCVFYNNILRD